MLPPPFVPHNSIHVYSLTCASHFPSLSRRRDGQSEIFPFTDWSLCHTVLEDATMICHVPHVGWDCVCRLVRLSISDLGRATCSRCAVSSNGASN